MADGFLAPDGVFIEKKEVYHAETARAILGNDSKIEDPVSQLLRRGYIAFIEFRKPGEQRSLHPDLDYVIGKSDSVLTTEQKDWIMQHVDLLSNHQQFIINEDNERVFRGITISNVRLHTECYPCEWLNKRKKYCEGYWDNEPAECQVCVYNKGV